MTVPQDPAGMKRIFFIVPQMEVMLFIFKEPESA
jgi:hypothetical protein